MIHKINTSWVRSIQDNRLTETFQDAWSTVINAVNGSWGDINYYMIPDQEVTAFILQGNFTAQLDTDVENDVTVSLPYISKGVSKVIVDYIVGDTVTETVVYVIEQGQQDLSITLQAGRKLITVEGTARRI